jgi:ferredoxin
MRYVCTGVKVCQHLAADIRDYHHTSVPESFWQRSDEIRSQEREVTTEKKAAAYYRSVQAQFDKGKACNEVEASCKLHFIELRATVS